MQNIFSNSIQTWFDCPLSAPYDVVGDGIRRVVGRVVGVGHGAVFTVLEAAAILRFYGVD